MNTGLVASVGQHLRNLARERSSGATKLDLAEGVNFDPDSVAGEENRSATEYGGVRVELCGYLGTARERIQIDVGFGDALLNGPVELTFPSLLNEDAPSLLAYSFETVISAFSAVLFPGRPAG